MKRYVNIYYFVDLFFAESLFVDEEIVEKGSNFDTIVTPLLECAEQYIL